LAEWRYFLGTRQCGGVLLKAFNAEKFGTDRLFVRQAFRRGAAPPQFLQQG